MPEVSNKGDARECAALYRQCLQLELHGEAASLLVSIQNQIDELFSIPTIATNIMPFLRDVLVISKEHGLLDQLTSFFRVSLRCIQAQLLGPLPLEVGLRSIPHVNCGCAAACEGLIRFLSNPQQLEFCFRKKAEIRKHMEKELGLADRVRRFSDGRLWPNMVSDGLDLSIDKSGSPQGLVVTKAVMASAMLLEEWQKRRTW